MGGKKAKARDGESECRRDDYQQLDPAYALPESVQNECIHLAIACMVDCFPSPRVVKS